MKEKKKIFGGVLKNGRAKNLWGDMEINVA